MSDYFNEKIENKTSSRKVASTDDITLQKAVDMGEYKPDYLATFPQWHKMSRIMQWEMIRTGIKNRRKLLSVHWAEINNQFDFSTKPHLKVALNNIDNQLTKLREDEEKYQVEYSI